MAVYQEKDKKKWTKDGRKWYFMVYKDSSKYKSKKYFTKKEAQDEEAIFILKKEMPYNKPFNLVAKDYFSEMYRKRKESTVFSYENAFNNNILPYYKNININKIDANIINNWHDLLDNTKLSVAYKNKLNMILSSILSFAQKKYGLDKNYAKIVGSFEEKNDKIINDKEKIRYITFDDFNKFISIIQNPLWHLFFSFAYYTGCRKGEMQALNWNDIDFDNNEIIVNKTLSVKTKDNFRITNTKNALNRKIKMSKIIKDELLQYKNNVMKYTDFKENWFVFGNSRFLPQTTIDNNKHKYFKLSGVKEITMHEFRHSHVSLLINEYIKSNQTDTAKFFLMMSNRMGHSIQVMQDTYMHLFPTIQDEIVDLLNNL